MTVLKKNIALGCLATLTVSLGYLVFLCVLDYYFVIHANEVVGWYNKAAFLVFTLPLVLAGVGYKLLSYPMNTVFAFVSIPVGLVISYFELLWVATEFHTYIGGTL